MFLPFPKNIDIDLLRTNLNLIITEYKSLTYKDFIDYSCIKSGIEDLINNPKSSKDAQWQVRPLIFKKQIWPGYDLRTIKILENLGVYPSIATFSRLASNYSLDTHVDHDEKILGISNTTMIKCHVTLDPSIDGQSGLIVGGETRILKQGDINFFDESVPHSAFNTGSNYRGVLLISWAKHELEF